MKTFKIEIQEVSILVAPDNAAFYIVRTKHSFILFIISIPFVSVLNIAVHGETFTNVRYFQNWHLT